MESRSHLRGVVGLAVLAMCLVLARASLDELEGSQVQTLEGHNGLHIPPTYALTPVSCSEDLLEIGERLGGMAGNGTQAPANATGVATGKNATVQSAPVLLSAAALNSAYSQVLLDQRMLSDELQVLIACCRSQHLRPRVPQSCRLTLVCACALANTS